MRTESVTYFTEKEEEFANLLIDIGTKRNVAKTRVPCKHPGGNLPRHRTRYGPPAAGSQYCHALPHRSRLDNRRESKAESKGRPVKIYELAKPIHDIMNSIEKEKKKEANEQLALVLKLRDYIR